MSKKKDTVLATGKRKSAVASAKLTKGSGKVLINGSPVEFFGANMYRLRIQEPIILAGDVGKKVDLHVSVKGGGPAGQADAIRLAIARALAEHKESLEEVFAEYDRQLLVADSRQRETRKPNRQGKARSKRQKSYR